MAKGNVCKLSFCKNDDELRKQLRWEKGTSYSGKSMPKGIEMGLVQDVHVMQDGQAENQ